MEHTVLTAIIGLYGALAILGYLLVAGFRKNGEADKIISERISLQMAESSGLMREMARKTDKVSKESGQLKRTAAYSCACFPNV